MVKLFKNIKGSILIILTSSIILSCSYTRKINLSKREIRQLDTIYTFKTNYKFFDTEWIFYDKQICQFKEQFIRKKIYTGTWTERNDTIFINFFYDKKVIAEKWKFRIYREKHTIESIQ